jgi:hypothetical protein
MKKKFELIHPKIKYPRLVEATKNEIRKYIKRERRKTLPEGVDFWDFDCKFGNTEAEAQSVHLSQLTQCIDQAAEKQLLSFYIEILAKPGHRVKKGDNTEVAPAPLEPRGFGAAAE